ncbi:co-chaperone YbbN [Streptomyces antimicrobicus]|uniref:Tetratricopeptide repeat protein n=1 Tax=Streptomyces antimicrobicus TaxID=2883108 RepID=A0ABS8AZU0_9ACTN|nr:tetratricopeptide repeat protein [Streptomyces antimicrobicus]MCB5177869.1 tetratricopeptide repeat protein [Streptomyces antimicrobicus]
MQPRNMSMSGVVDLAAVKAAGEAKAKAEQARAQAARQGGGAPGAVPPEALVLTLDEAGFEDALQMSAEVPVVIAFWSERSPASKELAGLLERLAVEAAGRYVLAKVDVDASPLLVQQFGIQGIPAVFAVVAGQALPLFQGSAPEDQVRDTLDQLVQIAEQRFGITGLVVDAAAGTGAPAAAPPGPHDALLEAAMTALDAGDLAGAVQAYKNVLAEDPGHAEAKLGLAQAELLQRVQGVDPQAVRAAAAADPKDAAAQIAAADLDLVGGHVEDAFGRLVDTVRVTFGDDRDTVRLRLLELFEIVGAEDPRVVKARTALARVLF